MHSVSHHPASFCGALAAFLGGFTLNGFLQFVSLVVGIVWMCFMIYESKTVQKWLGYPEGD